MFGVTDQPKEKESEKNSRSFAPVGLRVRVTIAIVVPLVIILSLLTVIQYQRQRTMMLSNLAEVANYSAQVVDENLVAQMQEADFAGVQPDMPMGPIADSLNAQLRESLLWSAATIFITILVVKLVLDRLVLRRLLILTQSVASFGRDRKLPLPLDNELDEIGRLTTAFRDMACRIEKRRQENQFLSERLRTQSSQRGELLNRVIQAQEAERKRVARELHDDLGQTMGGLALRAEVLARSLKPSDNGANEQLKQIRSLISSTTERMYDIILDLRPSALDDLGLVPALRAYAQRLLEHQELKFTIDGSELHARLPVEVETAVFRVFQEALNNTVRHSNATEVHAILVCKNGVFTGELVDNGQGFDPETVRVNGNNGRGLGLLGMQERVLQCGGRLNFFSEPGQGTRITIWIPLIKVCHD